MDISYYTIADCADPNFLVYYDDSSSYSSNGSSGNNSSLSTSWVIPSSFKSLLQFQNEESTNEEDEDTCKGTNHQNESSSSESESEVGASSATSTTKTNRRQSRRRRSSLMEINRQDSISAQLTASPPPMEAFSSIKSIVRPLPSALELQQSRPSNSSNNTAAARRPCTIVTSMSVPCLVEVSYKIAITSSSK